MKLTSEAQLAPVFAAGKRAGKSLDGTCSRISIDHSKSGVVELCTHGLAKALIVQLQTARPPALLAA